MNKPTFCTAHLLKIFLAISASNCPAPDSMIHAQDFDSLEHSYREQTPTHFVSAASGHFRFTQHSLVDEVRVPGDFEDHDYLLMSVGDATLEFAETISIIVKHASARIRIALIVNDRFDYEFLQNNLTKANCQLDRVTFLHVDHDTRWVRDYGPTSLIVKRKSRWLDWCYDSTRARDDEIPGALLDQTHSEYEFVPLALEGGNLLSNGDGVVVTSNKIFEANQESYTAEQIVGGLARTLNASDVVVLEPLEGEDTQHVDMFATFVNATTVFVGSYDPQVDPVNSAILDRNAVRLQGVTTQNGKRLRVIRIPMDAHEDGNWRTYTNCIYANGVVLVPRYDRSNRDTLNQVVRSYQHHLPDWQVELVDSTELIGRGGALRCASLGLKAIRSRLVSVDPEQLPGFFDGEPGFLDDDGSSSHADKSRNNRVTESEYEILR